MSIISAYQECNKRVLIHFNEHPAMDWKDGKNVPSPIQDAPHLAKIINKVDVIEIYQNNDSTGKVERYTFAASEIIRLYESVKAIMDDQPAPWKIEEVYEYLSMPF
jgi:hypothetical protein